MITIQEIMQETGLNEKQVYAGLQNSLKVEYKTFLKVHEAVEKLTREKNNKKIKNKT